MARSCCLPNGYGPAAITTVRTPRSRNGRLYRSTAAKHEKKEEGVSMSIQWAHARRTLINERRRDVTSKNGVFRLTIARPSSAFANVVTDPLAGTRWPTWWNRKASVRGGANVNIPVRIPRVPASCMCSVTWVGGWMCVFEVFDHEYKWVLVEFYVPSNGTASEQWKLCLSECFWKSVLIIIRVLCGRIFL